MDLYAALLRRHDDSERFHVRLLTEYPLELGEVLDRNVAIAQSRGLTQIDVKLLAMVDQTSAEGRDIVIESARQSAALLLREATTLPEEQRAYLGRYLIGTDHEGTVYRKKSS